MPSRRVDAKVETIRDQPVCRIFGEPRPWEAPAAKGCRLAFWWTEDGWRHDIECTSVQVAQDFIATIRARKPTGGDFRRNPVIADL